VDELLNKAGVSVDLVIGIGVGMPGAVKVDEGIAFFSPRHPNWRNVPIMQLIEERYGVYCFVEHVPNCSAIGERLYGAGRDLSNFVTILLGTGIGAGIIIDNRIYRGSTFNAGEIGHICVNPVGGKCTCGKTGCLELYASGRALTEKAEAYVRNSPNSILSRKAAENGGTINGYVIHQSAIDGDVKAQIFFHELGGYLGLGISIIVNLLNPGVVILDGGLSNASEFFMPALWESFENHIWEYSKVNIKVSQLPDATVIGAAGIVIQEIFQHGILLGNYQHEDTHQLEFS
jgi:predicted NBD/HSP70 family sugar kinase